jgi:hypothetical protein
MNIKSAERFTATITIGTSIYYSKKEYSAKELYSTIEEYQNKRINDAGIYLSAFVQQGDLVMSGQVEPHYKIEFINYPRFPLKELNFKDEITQLGRYLMSALFQNRIVIIFHNEILMLEEDRGIDPRIKIKDII